MEELWKARITLQGTVYLAIVSLWILIYSDWGKLGEFLNGDGGNPFITGAKIALGLFSGGTLLLTSGQLIAAITTICLRFLFWSATRLGFKKCGYFDTHVLDESDIQNHKKLSEFFSKSADSKDWLFRTTSAFDRRIALLYWGQLAILNHRETSHGKEIQEWVRRRWHAANAYFGAAFAAALAVATGWLVTCSWSWGLFWLAMVTVCFSFLIAMLYRCEVIRVVKFIIDKPAPPVDLRPGSRRISY